LTVDSHGGWKDGDEIDESPWVTDEYIQLLLSNEFHDAIVSGQALRHCHS
jgi:hypothetical protein